MMRLLLDQMNYLIARVILMTFNLIYSLYYYLNHVLFMTITEIVANLLSLFSTSSPESSLFEVNHHKKPTHVALALNEKHIQLDDVRHIIEWSNLYQVSYLTIFTNNDENIDKLSHFLMQSSNQWHKTDNYKKNGLISENGGGDDDIKEIKNKPLMNGHNNNKIMNDTSSRVSFCYKNVKILLLSNREGRGSLVEAVKGLKHLKRTISIEDVNCYLKKDFPLPDPELLLVFGATPCLEAFPPWQIRLTEIFFLPTLHNISRRRFRQILVNYSKCEQRFGK